MIRIKVLLMRMVMIVRLSSITAVKLMMRSVCAEQVLSLVKSKCHLHKGTIPYTDNSGTAPQRRLWHSPTRAPLAQPYKGTSGTDPQRQLWHSPTRKSPTQFHKDNSGIAPQGQLWDSPTRTPLAQPYLDGQLGSSCCTKHWLHELPQEVFAVQLPLLAVLRAWQSQDAAHDVLVQLKVGGLAGCANLGQHSCCLGHLPLLCLLLGVPAHRTGLYVQVIEGTSRVANSRTTLKLTGFRSVFRCLVVSAVFCWYIWFRSKCAEIARRA